MKSFLKAIKENPRYHMPVFMCLGILVILILLPTGYEDELIYKGTQRCRAEVTAVDNSKIISTGLIQSGEQTCTVKLLGSDFKGETVEAVNMLTGSLEQDKIFQEGDVAQVVISHSEGSIITASMIDHYRLHVEVILAGLFIVFLVLFAGQTGVRAILSFFITILAIWKIIVPAYLKGYNPVIVGLIIIIILTILIISLVYGYDRRTVSAAGGSILGILTTAILGIIFTNAFKIHGAVMTNSESLLYSGYQDLNLTSIFMASIFIGASGAVMDLAVDITSAISELVEQKPDITFKEAARSGMTIGRASMGTMTTTLLLAYSGGYVTLLMVFMAQGTPMYNILNYKYIAAEILDTIVGSFGLVTVAPFTAITSGYLLTKKKREECGDRV